MSLAEGKKGRPTSAADVVSLDLESTPVTDEGLKELVGLTSLEGLYLGGTKVTDRGVAELKKTLPVVKVTR